jgi:hypothetical protein
MRNNLTDAFDFMAGNMNINIFYRSYDAKKMKISRIIILNKYLFICTSFLMRMELDLQTKSDSTYIKINDTTDPNVNVNVNLNNNDDANDLCKKIGNVLRIRHNFYLITFMRLFAVSLFILQMFEFVNYLKTSNEIKNTSNNNYSFNTQCPCTGYEMINGTTNDIFDSITYFSSAFSMYPFIFAVRTTSLIIIFCTDLLICKENNLCTKNNQNNLCRKYKFSLNGKNCSTKGEFDFCLGKGLATLFSFLALLLSLGTPNSFKYQQDSGSPWWYDCSIGQRLPTVDTDPRTGSIYVYVPYEYSYVHAPDQYDYSLCNSTCAYQVDHINYRSDAITWTNIDVFCVRVELNDQNKIGYDMYLSILRMKELIITLTLIINISSIHHILSTLTSLFLTFFCCCVKHT